MTETFEDRLARELERASDRLARGRRRAPRAAALVVTAIAIVVVLVLLIGAGDSERTLPAKPADDAIHFVEVHIDHQERGRQERIVIREWRRGAQAHRLERYSLGPVTDSVVGRDGVMHVRFASGRTRVVRADDNADSSRAIRELRAGLVAQFDAWRAAGKAVPGSHRFHGRPARLFIHRQVIKSFDQNGKELLPRQLGPKRFLYVDRRTGAPLGWTLSTHYGTPRARSVTDTSRQRFVVIRDLPPTRENLAKLRRFSVRGPG